MRTNLERALNGRDLAALALGTPDLLGEDLGVNAYHLAVEDYETGLIDALTNLRHMARRYDIAFDEAVRTSLENHAAECRFAWDEVPD